jgi:integrase
MGRSLPILILEDGEVSLYALAWARELMVIENCSPALLSRAIRAIGLFYDFYMIIYGGKALAPNEMRGMMIQFFEAREYGNEELGWSRVQKKTAHDDVRYASEFSKFCAKNFGALPINPTETRLVSDLNVSDQLQFYGELKFRSRWDMLYHILPTTEKGQGISTGFSFNPKSRSKRPRYNNLYFPPDKVLPLIKATTNTRDTLAFLLLFFGGLRESELFHIFATDVTTPDGMSEIIIAHPELANYSWNDPFRGSRKGNRSTFLGERYGLPARNKLAEEDPRHAGWKGMMHTKNDYESEIYWLVPEIGRLFAHLHRSYMREHRYGMEDLHPYYFINLKNGHYGTPLQISNLSKSFYRAAAKIGLHPSETGVNPHGARHFYGHFCASYLKIDIYKTQVMMRHASLNSTATYYSIDERLVRQELMLANEHLAQDIPDFISALTEFVDRGF